MVTWSNAVVYDRSVPFDSVRQPPSILFYFIPLALLKRIRLGMPDVTSLLAVIRDWYGACQSLSFQGGSFKLPRKAISSRPANQYYAIPLYRLGFLSSIAQHTHSCLTSTSSMLAIRFSPLYIRILRSRAEPGWFLSVKDLSYWVRVVLLLLQKGIKKRTPLRLALHLNKMD